MRVQEYIENDFPFYHITPVQNIPSILENGLTSRKRPICVVRTDNADVWNEIAARQLSCDLDGNEYKDFAVIRLLPSKHNISWELVRPDNIGEPTAHLHNYITIREIRIDAEDIIVNNFQIRPIRQYDIPQDTLEEYYRR
ncbi:MAG: hypothetical protein IKL12_04650 [Alistipes sp.]|nr:hypothetical protein [Alistipes sp.]